MYTWENAVLTTKGIALLAKLTSGHTLSLVRAVAGAGYVGDTSLKYQSSVTGEKQELWFATQSYPEEGTCAVPVRLYNTGLSAGYIATQIGIYAMDPDEGEILYLIAQAGQDDGTKVPSESEMPGYSAEWTFYLKYGQADGVSVTVDPSNTVNEDRVRSIISEVVTKENLGIDKVDNTPDVEKVVKFASYAMNAAKVNNTLVIRLKGGSTEGTDMFTYSGGAAKSVNITAAKIGAEPAFESANTGCYYREVGGKKEWINPPLALNEEYQTTERFMGKPVYTKLVSFSGPVNINSEHLYTFHNQERDNPGTITVIHFEATLIEANGTGTVLPYYDLCEIAVSGGIFRYSTDNTDFLNSTIYGRVWYVYN